MSVNNPNFPTGQGERWVEESKIQKTVTIGLPSSLSSASVYQIPKTLTRHIAPSLNTQVTAISKPITAVQTLQKKDLQKIPLSLISTASVTTLPLGTALSNIIPVQIGTTTPSAATSSALHAPNASNIVRATHLPGSTHSVAFSHLPRGIVAASAHVRTGTAIAAVQKPAMPAAMQTSALGLHSQIRNVLPQMMHPSATPTTTIKPITTVSLAGSQATETHRASIPLYNVSSVGNTSSIQINLPASRLQGDIHGKGTNMHQTGKVHLSQTLKMTTQQPKAIITHAMTPIIQQTLAAKGNRGQPVSQSPVSVTVALSTTTVTIPIISSSSISTTIPIAKVPPQRQPNLTQSGHTLPSTAMPSATLDHRTESSTFPQPLPAHTHSTPATQDYSTLNTAHGQSSNSLFMPSYRGATPIVTSINSSVGHIEGRTEQTISPMAPFLPPLMLSPENSYYHQLMHHQVAAVAQGRQQQALLPSHAAVNMTALSQAVTEAPVASNIRFNHPLMVLPQSRQSTQLQTVPAQFHANSTFSDGINKVMTSPVPMIMTGLSVTTVSQAANSMHTAATQSHHMSHIGQPGHTALSATPVTNSNASPRPSILRKRTLNEGSAVKKQLLNSLEVLSPRPEPHVDSTPQSNLSSPKTPASGESQSSTDTALSSEATTPTQAHGDNRIKLEPQENGFGSTPEASPRKRRKQLLQANEELRDTPVSVSVFDRLVEACVKEEITEEYVEEVQEDNDDMDDFDVDDLLSDDDKPDMKEEYIDEEGIRWTLEKCRPNLALINFYNISWKPKNNHFIRYTDVKPKDERRPTINELSNQKGVLQKTSGWKLYHMAAQIEDLVELELELNEKLSGLQAAMGPDPPVRHSLMEDESSMLHELTQGNIQRCKLITDQLNDAMTQMLNVLDHKPKISEIISKHMSKRPIKKKERT